MSERKIRVLYVDDEENNLLSFKASFRKLYQITTAISVAEAEAILEKQSFHVILADQRMPQITGVQFFERVRSKYPDTLRVLITGHTDINAAIDAINKGEVFRFLYKPWDTALVESVIEQAYEIIQTRVDLKQRNADLEKAYEELDKFVYSASHDLRAPLTSILGIANLAITDDDVQELHKYLDMIRQSVHKLDTFIINIIDYYKNARGVPVISDVDFNLLVDDVKSSIQFMPAFQTIRIETNIQEENVFRSDLVKLKMIFNNLITNAVKFQDQSKADRKLYIDVDVTRERAHIVFKDNGMGIREEDLDRIFKMFYRADANNSGSGIGLYIVYEAVKKLGGTIHVSSIYGKESIFEIILPSIEK